MKRIGIAFDPNDVKAERKKKWGTLRAMITRENNHNTGDNTNEQSNDDASNQRQPLKEYDPTDLDAVTKHREQQTADSSMPLTLNLPDSALSRRMNLAVNTKTHSLRRQLPRYKREYYQRLINKYGRDYRSMHNDIQLNYLQWTQNQIRREITHFKHQFKFSKTLASDRTAL